MVAETRGKTRKRKEGAEESDEEFKPKRAPKGKGRGKKKEEVTSQPKPKRQRKPSKKAVEAEKMEVEKEEKKEEGTKEEETKVEEKKEEEKKEEEKKEERKEEEQPKQETGGPGKEEAGKHHEEHKAEILEKGLIYFFYRPKVGVTEAEGPEDVQRLYLLLWPSAPSILKDVQEMHRDEGKKGSHVERLIILAKKKLPEAGKKHERYFAFVSKVSRKIEDVAHELDAENYTTKTRGERHVEGARPIGEGVYSLVMYHGTTHLAYVLEIPEEPTDIQEAFNIKKEGSFIIQVKNPDMPTSQGAFISPQEKAKYPEELKKAFLSTKTGKELRFVTCNPVQLLDYEGAELLFIGASEDLKAELGEAGEYIEELEKVDARKITDDKLWKELHWTKKEHPPQALIKGKWT